MRLYRYTLKLRLFRPRSASLLQSFTSWLTGMPAEFSDPKFPSYGEGREGARSRETRSTRLLLALASFRVRPDIDRRRSISRVVFAATAVTRVQSGGHVKVQLNLMTKVRRREGASGRVPMCPAFGLPKQASQCAGTTHAGVWARL